MRFGAPRRLLTSRQGRTAEGAGSTSDEGVQERRQAGQSFGERGDAADGGSACPWWWLPTGQDNDGAGERNKAVRERTRGQTRVGARTREESEGFSLSEMRSMESLGLE